MVCIATWRFSQTRNVQKRKEKFARVAAPWLGHDRTFESISHLQRYLKKVSAHSIHFAAKMGPCSGESPGQTAVYPLQDHQAEGSYCTPAHLGICFDSGHEV